MYKHLFKTVLGVVGIFGILSLGVVDAKSETIYITGTDGTIIQTNNQEWEDIELYLINNCENTNIHYTIMDRNLGAETTGHGENAYGYYYQRGNNYGFLRSGETTSSEKVDTLGFGPGNYYASNLFITGNVKRSSEDNQNLWGGEGDTINSDGEGNKEDRRGPCPQGYHVPSAKEIDPETKFYFIDSYDSYYDYYPSYDILEPWAYYIGWDYDYINYNESFTTYRLSSPHYGYEYGRMMMGEDPYKFKILDYSYTTTARPIRCYKNEANTGLQINRNGGCGKFSISILGDKILSIKKIDPRKSYATFKGWYTNENFEGDSINLVVGTDISNITGIYAKFTCNTGYEENSSHYCEAINYSIDYEFNGGTFSGDNLSTYNINTNTFTLKNPTKTGYKFLGRTGSNGNVPQTTVSIPKGSTGDRKYYANWEKYPRYTYDANGGIFEYDGSERIVKYRNIDQILNVNVPIRHYINIPYVKNLHVSLSGKITGCTRLYIFTGNFTGYISTWPDEDHTSGYLYKLDKDSDAQLKFDINRDITFLDVPCFGSNSYEVSIFADYVLTKTGYSFAGWYEEGADNEFDITQPAVEDKFLYAHRIPNQYIITFDTDGGTDIPSITADYGTGITAPANPTKNGYTFKGRDKEIPSTMPAGNITIKAIWEKNGSSGGGGGGSSSLCKNLPTNAVANNNSKPSSNTNYYYSTNTSKVCTFQCKSGYTRNEQKETCDKVSDTQTTSGTNVKEPEANTGNNTKVETGNNTEIQTGSKIDTPEQASQDNKQDMQDSTTKTPEGKTNSTTSSTYSPEFQEAYEFAHEKGITTMPTIQKANMEGKLTRIAMAKMLSQYAMNVLGQKPANIITPKFNDVTDKQNSDYDDGVTLAYQLGIMGQNMPNNKFRPDDEVTRAEFATALSRMAYGTSDGEYKGTAKYYIHHMEKLVREGIITNDDPNMKELRGYVMIMLMRSSK